MVLLQKKVRLIAAIPIFFCDCGDYCIVVEAKATDQTAAQDEVQYYMINNKIYKDIIGISVSGQSLESISGIVNNCDKELLEYIRSMKPTRVIINPPYENNNPIKFTIQALNYLEPGGKLVIIMPTPTLSHNQGGD